MGHKAHPVGLRLGIHRKWKSNWFFESKNYAKFIHLNLNIEKFFKGFLYFYGRKTLLLNCQIIKMPSNQIFIFVFFYRFRKKIKNKNRAWKLKFWKRKVENYFTSRANAIINLHLSSNKFKHKSLKKALNNISKNNLLLFPENFYFEKKTDKLEGLLKLENTLKNLKDLIYFINFTNKTLTNLKISEIFIKNIIFNLKYTLKLITLNLKIFKIQNSHIINENFLNFHRILKIKLKNSKNIIFFLNLLQLKRNSLKLKTNFLFNKHLEIFINKNINTYKIFKKNILLLNKKFNNVPSIIKSKNFIFSDKSTYNNTNIAKNFLSKITNSKINLIFINALSFTKFFYLIEDDLNKKKKNKNKKKEKFNIFKIQKIMLNKYKYNAIFIKDFVHLAFISVLLKNTNCLVQFMGEQFKRLPKNRKQMKLLNFIQQTLKIFCEQRNEVFGFKLQLQGRLNRRNRTRKWVFQKGALPIQTYKTRVEYGYSEGWTRSGLIGIKLWFFYKKHFKILLKKKLLLYLHYSKIKNLTSKKPLISSNFIFDIKQKNNNLTNILTLKKLYTTSV